MNTLQRGILWVILISVFVPAEGANWTQNGGITEKAYTAKHLIAPGVINPSPSYDYCKGGEGFGVTGDIALVFDISSIIQMTGDTFDVNNIHVDAFVDGKYTLNKWLDNWQSKGNHTRALGLLYGNNLLGKSSITVCVGSLVQLVTTDAGLQSIFLWYDGPIAVPSHVSTSPPMYTNINGNIGGSIPESKAPHPITGGKHPGDLPDLIVNDFYPVKNEGDRTALTQLRVNQTYFCAIQVKNVGQAGAWGTWANRCYLSKGNKEDRDHDNLGHANITDLRSGKSQSSRRVFVPIPPFKYPGRHNITACTDTDGKKDGDKKITESDEGNNCHDEVVFDVVSDPNLVISSLTASTGEPQTNQSFTVTVTTANRGESFGQDKQSTALYIDGIPFANHWRSRETLQGGMSEAETITVSGIATVGTHTLTACADFNGLVPEVKEDDNCTSVLITVQPAYVPPKPTDPGRAVVSPPTSTPFSLACGTLPKDADFSSVPAVMDGDVASTIIGNNRQRIFLPQANLVVAGGWNDRLQAWVPINPSQVSRVCWSSNESGWGTAQASCGNGFVLSGTNWVADIPNTPLASKGVWTLKQAGDTVWLDSQSWTAVPSDVDGQIRYGGWDVNRLTLTQDPLGYAVLTASFGVRGAPGYWFPAGAVLNGKVLWHSATDPSSTMPGTVTCDPSTGRITAKVSGVNPGSSGRLILGLSTPSGQYGWPMLEQWTLPTGAVLSTGGEVTLPTDFSFKYGNPQVTYDKAAQRLTLIIRSDDLMAQAYWNVPGVGVLTDAVWFNAWIAPAGQYGKMIKGTLSRSDTGVWTIVFEGLPSGYGGSMYIVHTDATQSWQNVGGFRYSTGINVHVDASKGEGWYIMP